MKAGSWIHDHPKLLELLYRGTAALVTVLHPAIRIVGYQRSSGLMRPMDGRVESWRMISKGRKPPMPWAARANPPGDWERIIRGDGLDSIVASLVDDGEFGKPGQVFYLVPPQWQRCTPTSAPEPAMALAPSAWARGTQAPRLRAGDENCGLNVRLLSNPWHS
jgi:hypothetical protein